MTIRDVAELARVSPASVSNYFPQAGEAWHETPYGMASAGWRREGDRVHFRAEALPNTTAHVTLPSGATHDVGSGVHTWVEAHPRPVPARGPLSLSSGLAEIIDDPEAYRAVLAAIRATDPERAEVFRRTTTRWTPGRQLREPLNKAPLHVLEAIEKALAALLRR